MSLTGSGTTTRCLGGLYHVFDREWHNTRYLGGLHHEFDREWHNNEVFRGIIPCV